MKCDAAGRFARDRSDEYEEDYRLDEHAPAWSGYH
jgi:hypothetical protein